MLEKKIISETKKRNPDLQTEKVLSIAKDVAVGTLRYEMIKQDLDRIITFDLSKSLSLEGDTASYIQYTFARASRILEKSTHKPDFNATYDRLLDEFEIKLIKLIGMFEIPIRDSAKNLAPKIIAKYCHELSENGLSNDLLEQVGPWEPFLSTYFFYTY